MKAGRIIAIAILTLLATAGPALADLARSLKSGEAIARESCNGCHQPGKSVKGGAPSFSAIARMDSATILSIRVYLRTSHINKTMPNLIMSEEEVDAVARYILSLKP